MKREPKIKPTYECLCDERLQTKTKRFTRLTYTYSGFAFVCLGVEYFWNIEVFFCLFICNWNKKRRNQTCFSFCDFPTMNLFEFAQYPLYPCSTKTAFVRVLLLTSQFSASSLHIARQVRLWVSRKCFATFCMFCNILRVELHSSSRPIARSPGCKKL
jgi:hypothetical protein